MKKFIAAIAVAGMLGAGAYFGLNTNYRRIPDVWSITKKVVFQKQEYPKVLLSEIEQNADEKTADEAIEAGYRAKKKIFGNRNSAEKFIKNPYDLRIRVEHSKEGEAAYFVDLASGEILPVYEDDQVGDLEHRLSGIPGIVKEEVEMIFEQAKQFTNYKIDEYLRELR